MGSQGLKVQVWIHFLDAQGVRSVLLLQTKPDRGKIWQPVTGHVDDGETPVAAALREAKEETGLAFDQRPLALGMEFTFGKEGRQYREEVFTLELSNPYKLVKPPAITLDPNEHIDYKWLWPLVALPMLPYGSQQDALRKFMQTVKP